MTPSWYDILDIEPSASPEEVRAAWRAGIADLEPGSRRFQTLNQAAEVLLDEQRRSAYDAELAAGAPTLTPRAPDREQGPVVREVSKDEARESRRASKALARERRGEEKAARTSGATAQGSVATRSVPGWLLGLLGVLAAASVALAVWIAQAADAQADAREAASQAQAAAERAIVPVLSYDHTTLEADRKRATAYLTGDYREDYDELFAVISDNAPTTETKVVTEVIASGIVRSGEDRVDVLVFVDRPTTNKLSPEPVVYKDQVTVTMQKVGEDWLVDNLKTSPATQ
ncbi:J domain-containing protein [Nocardioides piscis]|uniref:J domain-containing protein n=1 Tax=Nocardioides piscis TaxID=2714938 RepID=A0A6G7YCH8_9ACTN|nr:DnaJ domain-containing protein [Nocardioides piscis]QIK74429.1 J domain-containing protein [Nocardioides piscis]